MGKLDGKVAVITGGNSGIGLASAKALQDEGAKVVLFGRNHETLNAAAQELGGDVLVVQGDVAQLSDIDRLFAQVERTLGKIDVLFVNAGIAKMAPVEQVTEEFFDQIMTTNLKGAYFTVQKAISYLNDNASVILNASINANIGMPTTSVYGASKAALVSLARTLSADLVERGIRVNAVSPGPVETPLFGRTGMTQEQMVGFTENVVNQIPLKRFGRPEELASIVTFLASPDSSFILGTEIVADGGMSQL
ncbi:MAG: NAD(P)-dependent dehydrogenase, short-chain alcohol dehydrogenase family [Chloroflexi bacterium AL-W]|nr:NAD(P)-dependent dehydrogenase, short-chain alcohol dehydrogenase family [Chloroflexi bacterium AL-N1]NOK67974.1 NAD(P)-dependent dehydrogenase, short-chain alcohol dehydrogenase family [Chloroflexi bacterium AL-N10]NOK73314.1 NAD(P)-dependent dehydrogenase, short-chain alcohol dehydrogenase family [Chloroflexi bacterium AL-N5]NOK83228.1 NAD(P)-dependent dehydrogenase, short-chain alcohol dehydrogenase family [Chloroflexi bacterium AL-W]NOK87645.1 NAD(P)-dependent dehydrogenase, short-chain 